MVNRLLVVCVALLWLSTSGVPEALAQAERPFRIRGRAVTLRVYGHEGGAPVVVASGDGGWIHLGPKVAGLLARNGYFVVGLDSRQYLSVFTSGSVTLKAEDVPGDFKLLADYAASKGNGAKPVLVGVSEGAGLSVLAAVDPLLKPVLSGVIGLGLPDINELGWRWRDSIIYLTHKVPNEPTFSVEQIIDRVAPLPLAALHATGDEFVSVPIIRRMMSKAREPSRLWVIQASDHQFTGNQKEFEARVIEALAWIKSTHQ